MVQRPHVDFVALGIIPRFAIFYCQFFLYFQVFHNFHILRQTDIHNCSKFMFLLTRLEFSQHRMLVRKRRKAVKRIAVGYVKVTDQP